MAITTIVMPVSRRDFLHRIFAQLDMMPCDREKTNLLVYVDGDGDLFNFARNFVINSKFKDKLCVFRKKGKGSDNYLKDRRQRIADIHNEIKGILGFSDFLFLIEDDTLFPLNTLNKLLKAYSANTFAGFITGVQIGRWGMTVPGIWKCDTPYETTQIESLLPKPDKPFEQIDAAGMYCCLTRTELYKKVDFQPFDAILGPDVAFGLALRREGYKNYVDWTLNTEHLTKNGSIKVENTHLMKVIFRKIGEKRWNQEVL